MAKSIKRVNLKIEGNKAYLHTPDGYEKVFFLQETFKNVQEYKRYFCRGSVPTSKVEVDAWYPCINYDCLGTGWIYDPNDPPDCIEGNKGRRRIKCPTCSGIGTSTKKTFYEFYRNENTARDARRKQQLEDLERLHDVVWNVLDEDEFKLIRRLL